MLESLKGGFARAGTKRSVRTRGFLGKEMFDNASVVKNCKNVKQPQGFRMCGGCVVINAIILLIQDLNTENIENIEQALAQYELPACLAWTNAQLIKALLVIAEDVLSSKLQEHSLLFISHECKQYFVSLYSGKFDSLNGLLKEISKALERLRKSKGKKTEVSLQRESPKKKKKTKQTTLSFKKSEIISELLFYCIHNSVHQVSKMSETQRFETAE